MAKKRIKISQQITNTFEELLEEYLPIHESKKISNSIGDDTQNETKLPVDNFNSENEPKLIRKFFTKPCLCGKLCKDSLNFDEVTKSRKEFSSLSWIEKNAFMLSQLSLLVRVSDKASSARQLKTRVRQKFDYHVSIDRPVCKEVVNGHLN